MPEPPPLQPKGVSLAQMKQNEDSTTVSMGLQQRKSVSLDSDNFKQIFLRLQDKKPLTIVFKDLCYRVPGKEGPKTILDSVSGKFRSGRLVALMGPSGAGKSTLTNILAGYITENIEGEILVNGKPRNLGKFRKNSCYIMQEDMLLPHLTVMEAMTFSANLRLRESTERKKAMVQMVLEVLGLTDCASTRSVALSGGQKKRLAIAQELLSNPPIMFFDEPTSGLDSASCYQCVSLLKELALGGRTIICTIHQPSAKLFEMFDRLYFVVQGCCLYDGRVSALVPYLASQGFVCPSYHNPTDYFMELVSEDPVQCGGDASNAATSSTSGGKSKATQAITQLAEAVKRNGCAEFMRQFNLAARAAKDREIDTSSTTSSVRSSSSSDKSPEQSQDDGKHSMAFSTGTLNQFRVLYVRTFLSIIRDTQLTLLRLFSHVTVGLLIGMLYFKIGNDGMKFQSNAGCLFFCMLFIMFTALMPTVLTFPSEMKIFLREHLNYWYSIKAYYFAKTMADMPFQIIFPAIYGAIVYFMTDQPMEFDRYALFVTMCVLTSLVAQSFGLLVGAATSLESAVFLGPVTAIPILLFSGFFLTFSTIPVYLRWLSYCSYIRYAFEGAMQVIYGMGRENLKCQDTTNARQQPSKCVQRPADVLELFDVNHAKIEVDIIVLGSYFLVLRALCFLVLALRARMRR